MRGTKLILGVLAVMMAMMVAFTAPAMADHRNHHHHHNDFCDFFFDNCRFDRFGFNGGFGDFEQDADSGDIDQSFDVTGGEDNSNQTVGLEGVSNTGNAQDQIGITQIGSEADDFDFEDSGSSIEVSPENSTTSDQEVNQAASAS